VGRGWLVGSHPVKLDPAGEYVHSGTFS
jgi:hypothetical protein